MNVNTPMKNVNASYFRALKNNKKHRAFEIFIFFIYFTKSLYNV